MVPLASTGEQPPDNSIGYQLWVGVLTTAIPATVAVALRFYARMLGELPLRADDWLILVSLGSVWTMAGLRFSHLTLYDLGHHTIYVAEWQVRHFKRSFLATQIFYFLTGTCTRSSILFLYRRIFVSKRFNIVVWIAMSLVIGYFVSCSIAAIFGCQPVSYFWNEDQPGRCMNEYMFFKVNGIFNLILDIIVLILPWPMLWRLQMHTRKKVALCMIFSLGLFACLCSCFRLVQFRNPKWKNHEDPMRTFMQSSLWSSIEQNVGVVCACLPCMRLLLRPGANWGPEGTTETTECTERPRALTQPSTFRTVNGQDGILDDLKERSDSELELTAAPSVPHSLGRSVVTTSHSDVDTEKTDNESQGRDDSWQTQEIQQSSRPDAGHFR